MGRKLPIFSYVCSIHIIQNYIELQNKIMLKQMPSVFMDNLKTFEEVLDNIDNCLQVLKHNAIETDFFDIDQKTKYMRDVEYTQQFFERGEVLLRNADNKNNEQ